MVMWQLVLLPFCLASTGLADIWSAGDAGQFTQSLNDMLSTSMSSPDLNVQQVGGALRSAAPMLSMMLPYPGNLVLGSVAAVAGSALTAVGGGGGAEPTSQDLVDAINSGMHKLGVKFDRLLHGIRQMRLTMQQMERDVSTLYEDLHLGVSKMKKIDSVYMVFMERLNESGFDHASSQDCEEYAISQSDSLAALAFLIFTPANLEDYLARWQHDTALNGGIVDTSSVALALHAFLSARLKLFTIEWSSVLFKHRAVTAEAVGLSTHLKRDTVSYYGVSQGLGLPMNVSTSTLIANHRSCVIAKHASPENLDSHQLAYVKQTLRCCCMLDCPVGFECPCPQDASKAHECWDNLPPASTTPPLPCHQDTGGTCKILGCDGWRGPVHCSNDKCLCSSGFCANSGGACSKAGCDSYTGGSCFLFSCDNTRGATECKDGWCMCAPNFCQKDGRCTRRGSSDDVERSVTGAGSGTQSMCMQDTGGTCFFFGCDASRGPAHCLDNRCICTPGFCASSEGTCSRSACKTSTGGTCHVLSCDATRGPTECLNGWCMCSPGYCANEGRCVLERGETRWDAAAAIFEAMPANFSALDAHVGSGNMFAGSIWAVALALLLLPASLAIAFKISFKRRDVSASAMEHLLS
mmetsp:Transcript_110234/g.310975  ORF Transcript_110234/g.310975 Transcript_110234/m.310975 type:complete len:636 (-) Transcript_110234:39-1946(-)